MNNKWNRCEATKRKAIRINGISGGKKVYRQPFKTEINRKNKKENTSVDIDMINLFFFIFAYFINIE